MEVATSLRNRDGLAFLSTFYFLRNSHFRGTLPFSLSLSDLLGMNTHDRNGAFARMSPLVLCTFQRLSFFIFHLNCFTEMYFTCYKIYPFKECNPVVFSIFRVLHNLILEYFHEKKLHIHQQSLSTLSCLGNHSPTFCLYRPACFEEFIRMESYNM